jgi:hypothetical protein
LGNGTVVDIIVRYVDYGTTQGLYFKKMRVLKLVPYEKTGTDFEPLSEDDEFFGAAVEPEGVAASAGDDPFARLPDGLEPEVDEDIPE